MMPRLIDCLFPGRGSTMRWRFMMLLTVGSLIGAESSEDAAMKDLERFRGTGS